MRYRDLVQFESVETVIQLREADDKGEARNLVQTRPAQRLGKQRQHLKLWVQGAAGPVEVVWWNAPPQVTPSARLDLAFAAQVNTFMGRRSLQLKLLDWRAAG